MWFINKWKRQETSDVSDRKIDFIFLHIPKTGGTSFYQILKKVYGEKVSVRYNRSMIQPLLSGNKFRPELTEKECSFLCGHFYYKEIKHIHLQHNAKIICWLRDPIERVISNYRFFKKGLKNPYSSKNPGYLKKNYLLNQHRVNETLLEYASKKETQNRMSKFLEGVDLKDIFFYGFLENFEESVNHLENLLDWTVVEYPYLNQVKKHEIKRPELDERTLKLLKKWNQKDIKLYQKALALKQNRR